VAVNNSIKVGPFGFLVINVCNHAEHYEMPCITQHGMNNVQVVIKIWRCTDNKQTCTPFCYI
jgi:hypothetical protein